MSDTFYPKMPQNAQMCCRFTVDDNIFFLEDLTKHTEYKSIFNNDYLAMYRRFHEKYGIKVTFNLFYSYYEDSFSLDEVTDRFKEEFIANSDWMRFAFHARHNAPPYPYEHADGKTLLRDFDEITGNIIRFAGKECISNFITIHYVLCPATAALKERSVIGFMSIPEKRNGKDSYTGNLTDDEIITAMQNSINYDEKTQLYYITNDMVINKFQKDELYSELEKIENKKNKFIDVMIHEQYFCKHLEYYQPDAEQKLDIVFKFLKEHGYSFVLADEIL